MDVELSPPEIETAVRHYAQREGVLIETLLSRGFPPLNSPIVSGRDEKNAPMAPVSALLYQWQQEYGLPPRPDGQTHTSVQELVAQWNEEDAWLTPEEVQAERRR